MARILIIDDDAGNTSTDEFDMNGNGVVGFTDFLALVTEYSI